MKFRATLMLALVALAFLVTTFAPVEANLSENSLDNEFGYRSRLIKRWLRRACKGKSSAFCRRFQLASLADVSDTDDDMTGEDYDGADFEDLSDEEAAALMEWGFFKKIKKAANNIKNKVTAPVKKVINIARSNLAKACAYKMRLPGYKANFVWRRICAKYTVAMLDVSDDDEDIEDIDADMEALENSEELDDEDVAVMLDWGFFKKIKKAVNNIKNKVTSPVKKVISFARSKLAKACAYKMRLPGYKANMVWRRICAKYSVAMLDISDDDEDIEDIDADMEALENSEDLDDEDVAVMLDWGVFKKIGKFFKKKAKNIFSKATCLVLKNTSNDPAFRKACGRYWA